MRRDTIRFNPLKAGRAATNFRAFPNDQQEFSCGFDRDRPSTAGRSCAMTDVLDNVTDA